MKVTRCVEVIKQQETFNNNNIFDTIQRKRKSTQLWT